MENGFFEIELLGIHPTDRDKDMRVWIHGDKDPGYKSTAKMISESAMALAQDDLRCWWWFLDSCLCNGR